MQGHNHYTGRLRQACCDSPPCPECGTKQVQIIDYSASPMKWKCRHCAHRFTYESKEHP